MQSRKEIHKAAVIQEQSRLKKELAGLTQALTDDQKSGLELLKIAHECYSDLSSFTRDIDISELASLAQNIRNKAEQRLAKEKYDAQETKDINFYRTWMDIEYTQWQLFGKHAPLLTRLKDTLERLEAEFPPQTRNARNDDAVMSGLVQELSNHLYQFLSTDSPKKDIRAYEVFKSSVLKTIENKNYQAAENIETKEQKPKLQEQKLEEPKSILGIIWSKLVAVFHAIINFFDSIIKSFRSAPETSTSATSNTDSYSNDRFYPSETKSSQQKAKALFIEFDKAIKELDESVQAHVASSATPHRS